MNTKGQEDSLDIFLVKDKDKAFLARKSERAIIHSEGSNDLQNLG